MLIRLCGHYIDNPNHIDKMICINGLPEDFFFRENKKYDGKELVPPWTPDVEANIPAEIRHLCKPFEVVKVFPPIEKGRDPLVDRLTVSAVRFDYGSEAGQTTWDRIERYLERMVPRDQLVPKPVLVAPNQKSGFDPHEARRTVRGSLELRKSSIPVIDLTAKEEKEDDLKSTIIIQKTPLAVEVKQIPLVDRQKAADIFKCAVCGRSFEKDRALWMHTMKKHKKNEKVEAGV